MRIIRYSTAKLAMGLGASILMTMFSFVLLQSDRGKVAFAGFVFVVIGPVLALGTIRLLVGDRLALRFDNRSIEIGTMWRRRLFSWPEIVSIGMNQVSSYALYGLVKTGTSHSLTIKTQGGLFSTKSYNISKAFLDIGKAEYDALAHQMARAKDGAMPETDVPRHVPQPTAVSDTPMPEMAFDADAAFARYLEKQREQPEATPMLNGAPLPVVASGRPQRSGFGRKGL